MRMHRPKWLTDADAVKCWDWHSADLEDKGVLTSTTVTSFAILCQVFSDWKNASDARVRAKCLDLYFKLGSKFGLIPHISAAAKIVEDQQDELDPKLARLLGK